MSQIKDNFEREKSKKRFAGNINQNDMDFEDKAHDRSLSCENAGSSNSQENDQIMEKVSDIKDTDEGMYSYISDDDLEEEHENQQQKSQQENNRILVPS